MKQEIIQKLNELITLVEQLEEAKPEEPAIDVSDLLLLREQFDAKYGGTR